MACIIGIDVALRNTGFVVLDSASLNILESKVLKNKSKTKDKKSVYTYDHFNELSDFFYHEFQVNIPDNCPEITFVVEGDINYGHVNAMKKIMFARSALFCILKRYYFDAEVLVPRVQEWKKELLGRPNASKAYTLEWIKENYYFIDGLDKVFGYHDTVDALALALYGMKKKERETV